MAWHFNIREAFVELVVKILKHTGLENESFDGLRIEDVYLVPHYPHAPFYMAVIF